MENDDLSKNQGKFPFANWVIFHCQSGNETNLLRSWEPPEKIYSNAIRSLLGAPGCWEPIAGSYHRFPMVSCSRCVFAHFRCFLKMETCKDGCQVVFFLTTIFLAYNSFVLALLQDLLLRGKAATPKNCYSRYIE